MPMKKIICWVQIILLACPVTQGWGQQQPRQPQLDEQASFYLQQIGPGQAPAVPTPVPLRPTLPRGVPSAVSELPPQPPQLAAPAQVLTTAPRQPEEISAVERRAWDQSMLIRQFGYSFFSQPPASFLPLQAAPVGPDYVIGPGDTVHILVWGSVQGEYSLTVERSGQIAVPKVGAVHVSGLTFKQLKEVLDREFSRLFTNFQMSVNLDNLRTIQVFVVGQARSPGSYAVSSLSTLVSALFAAGGPTKSGSLRAIEVRRGPKAVVHFDMYDFLLKGDKSKDIRLHDGDVIFIPPVGSLVAIGYPRTPDEIEEELRLLARLELDVESVWRQPVARGPEGQTIEYGWREREARRIITEGASEKEMQRQKREAELLGFPDPTPKEEVKKPDRAPSLSWLRRDASEEDQYFKKRYGLTLKEAIQKIAMSKRLDAGGPIKVPAIYEIKNERTLKDLLAMSGGLGDIAFKGRVQVLRVKDRREMVLFEDDLTRILHPRFKDVSLVDGDFVRIFKVPSQVERKVVIAGAVKMPGEYGLQDSMRVKDLIQLAGGLHLYALMDSAEITRTDLTPQGPQASQLLFNLRRALDGNTQDNLVLKPNDYIFVRALPQHDIYRTVKIEGEVKYPGTYAVKRGETLSALLARVGGFTDNAYPLGAVLTRPSVKKIQKEQLDEALNRAESAVLAFSAERAAAGTEADEARRAEVAARQQQLLLAKLRTIEPLGRIVIRLDDPERLRGTPRDIEMQDGDRLLVPEMPGTVNVVGAVFNPTSVVFSAKHTVRDYLNMVGGTTRIADEKQIYVIKVTGAAVSAKAFGFLGVGRTWDGAQYVSHAGGVQGLRLDPGDTIVVPERYDRIAWLKQIKDITTILGQIAVTAGVILLGLK